VSLRIRDVAEADRDWMRTAISAEWGSPVVVSRGRLHHADQLPGLVADHADGPVGLLTYRISEAEMEVVTLQALERRRGTGSALLAAARGVAARQGCRRVWLVTTNDNTVAQSFYRAVGMELVAVHYGAVVESRKLKPEIPLVGAGGCPIEDELEFELRLPG
jgi:GNAT superfamily N-acetyltransferase